MADTETPPRAEFTERMEKHLEELKREFQKLELDQMKKGELEARKRLEAAKKSVEQKRADFQKELKRAKSVSDQAWDDVSATLRNAWNEMKEAVERARTDFAREMED